MSDSSQSDNIEMQTWLMKFCTSYTAQHLSSKLYLSFSKFTLFQQGGGGGGIHPL